MGHLGGPLAPGFLIASPPLGDPNFDRTVVLLATHGPGGALGFVVNRVAPMKLGKLLVLAGYTEGASDESEVLVGGPVQPSSGWILYEDAPSIRSIGPSAAAEASGRLAEPAFAEPAQEDAMRVGERLRLSSSRGAFDALARAAGERESGAARGSGERRRLVILGYSGWGPGQLEGEIAVGAWLPVPLDEAILFDTPVPDRWEGAYALLGLTPADMMSMNRVGDA